MFRVNGPLIIIFLFKNILNTNTNDQFLFLQLFGLILFAITIWLRSDTDLQEWIDFLNIGEFYYGASILIFAGIVVVATGFIGCGSSLMENDLALYVVSKNHLYLAFIIEKKKN